MVILGSEGAVSAKALGQEGIVSSGNYRNVIVDGGVRKHQEELLFSWLLVSR